MRFTEDFLQFIWQHRLFVAHKLQCVSGESLSVLHPGILNRNAGPDFSRADLRIGGTRWVGNVEVHIRSSEWFQHQHQYDEAYDAIVLHVVYEDDKPVRRKDGTLIPTIVLKDLFAHTLLENYNALLTSIHSFPCEQQIAHVDPLYVNGFLSRLMAERFEEKSQVIFDMLAQHKGSWDEVFYHLLAKSFGFKVNAVPFEILARSLSMSILAKHRDHPLQVEALLFGQAGFLNRRFREQYPRQLQSEYTYLQKKYHLKPLDVSLWKFLRMRPSNFPTIRLAQFAALIVRSNHLFAEVLDAKDIGTLKYFFQRLRLPEYWDTHYHFGKQAEFTKNQMGDFSIESLIINTVCFALFAYGKYVSDGRLMERAFCFLEELSAEKNAILKLYAISGVSIVNAFDSQSVLQLNKNYCSKKKCLNCGIGIKILNR